MNNILGNILGILLIIGFIIGFRLFIQFMSKISGNRIVQKGSGKTVAIPNDFNDSIETIKKASNDIEFFLKKIKLNNLEQVIYKIDKVLAKTPGLNFRSYYKTKIGFEKLIDKIVSEGKISKTDLLKRMNLPGIVMDGVVDDKTYTLLTSLRISYSIDLSTFDQSDLNKIQSFILPAVQNDISRLHDFLDVLGRPNFKEFAEVIDLIEKMYLNRKIDNEEIINVKKYILKRKGLIDTIV